MKKGFCQELLLTVYICIVLHTTRIITIVIYIRQSKDAVARPRRAKSFTMGALTETCRGSARYFACHLIYIFESRFFSFFFCTIYLRIPEEQDDGRRQTMQLNVVLFIFLSLSDFLFFSACRICVNVFKILCWRAHSSRVPLYTHDVYVKRFQGLVGQ